MKTPATLLFCYAMAVSMATAQSIRYAVAMPYLSMGAYSGRQLNPFSFTGNQAALARVKHPGFAVYGERRFLLAETNAYIAAAVMPSNRGNFGLQVHYAGFRNFNENRIGLAYGRSLGSRVDIGVQFNYYSYRIPAYGNASAIYAEAGAILHFSAILHGGIYVYNPVGGKLGKAGDEKLASVYKAGLGYDATPDLFIGCEVIREEGKPVNVITGMQYQLGKIFFAKAGVSTDSGALFCGAGVGWGNWRTDLSVSYHPQLGFSPGLLLVMQVKNADK